MAKSPLTDDRRTRRIAVVGAGVSGLSCARRLTDAGMAVTLFEKSRGTGGRLATRRMDEGRQFDHGAPFFTASEPRFREFVETWRRYGIVRPWEGRVVTLGAGDNAEEMLTRERLVAVPRMNAFCRYMAAGLRIRTRARIVPPRRVGRKWHLCDDRGTEYDPFDMVIVSAPPPQSALLLEASPDLAQEAASVETSPCWALMLEFAKRLPLDFDGAFVLESPLAWIARDSSKPGRNRGIETWVLHGSPDWSRQHLEAGGEDVVSGLLDAFGAVTGIGPVSPTLAVPHRWRYSLISDPLPKACLFDDRQQIGACGDWCGGVGVEGAFLSGLAMAERALADALGTFSGEDSQQ